MAEWPDDDNSVDDLETIALEPVEPADRPKTDGGDEDRSPHRRRLLVLAVIAAVSAVVIVSVAVSRDNTDAEAGPEGRSPPSAAHTTPVPPTVPLEQRPPPTTPGDATTTTPLLPEGAPSTPDVGVLVASDMNFYGGGAGSGPAPLGAYYLYADGRLLWASDPTAQNPGFVEQQLTPEGVERLRSKFLATGLFQPRLPPPTLTDCNILICVRDNEGALLAAPGSERMTSSEAGRVSNLRSLAESLPATDWADRRIKAYVPARFALCLQTFANIPDRAIPVALDLPRVVPTFPSQAASLLGGRTPIGTRPNPDPACFEVTLDEARTIADEFLGPDGGGSHEYSGIVVRSPQLAAITTAMPQGIVGYVRFNTLLPHPESAAAFSF